MIQPGPLNLIENRMLRFSMVTVLYFVQGISLGVMSIAIPGYMYSKGMSMADTSSFLAVIMIPWSFKFVAAPVMDKFTYWAMGRRRPWMITATFLSALAYAFAFLVPIELPDTTTLTIICLIISSCTAVMDISVDGLAVDIFPEKEQSAANGFMWGSKVFGSAFSAILVTQVFNSYGISVGLGLTGLSLIAFAMVPVFIRERRGEKLLPWTDGARSQLTFALQTDSWMHLIKLLLRNLLNKTNLIASLIILTNGLAYGYFDAFMPALTVNELGWSNEDYSKLAATAGLVGGAAGILLSGPLMKWLGTSNTLYLLLSLLMILPLILFAQAQNWENRTVISVFAIATLVIRTMTLIAIFALCMTLCEKSISATHFALFTAFGNLGISSGSWVVGGLSNLLSFQGLLLFFSFISVTTLLLNFWMSNAQKVKNLMPISDLQ